MTHKDEPTQSIKDGAKQLRKLYGKRRPPNYPGLMKAGSVIERARLYYLGVARDLGFLSASVYVSADVEGVDITINVGERVFKTSEGRRTWEQVYFNGSGKGIRGMNRRIVDTLTEAATYKKYRKT